MDEVTGCVEELLSAIRESSVYKEYKKHEVVLEKEPELMERVNRFRANNFRLQNEEKKQELFHMSEVLTREASQLKKIPEVSAYLNAELALCRLMQQICATLTNGIDINIPYL